MNFPASRITLTSAAAAARAATIDNTLSIMLTPPPREAAGAGGAGGRIPVELDGAAVARMEEGDEAGAPAGGCAGAAAWAPAAGAGACGVGSFMVGEAVGLGGRLIRTVSVFGCTLATSTGLGGMGAAGKLGTRLGVAFGVLWGVCSAIFVIHAKVTVSR